MAEPDRRASLSGFFCCVLCCATLESVGARAADAFDVPTLSEYGGPGLLDTRSARMLPDGALALSVSVVSPDDRIALTFQALPWLEATFRYSLNYGVKLQGPGVYYDRSFDVKFRLWEETTIFPQFAVGFQDVIGTGIYAGEYMVASKQYGPFDFSLGLGWGRLASRGTFTNPFGILSQKFLTRPGFGTPGAPSFQSYFRGQDAGLFGGVDFQTPIPNVKVQLEYSSDTYALESQNGGHDYNFPINAGLSYHPYRWMDLGVSVMHGRDIGVRLSTVLDPTSENWPVRLDPPPRFAARGDEVTALLHPGAVAPEDGSAPPADVATPLSTDNSATPPPAPAVAPVPADAPDADTEDGEDNLPDDLTARIRAGFDAQRLKFLGGRIHDSRLAISIENDRYRRDADALSRATRVLSAVAPPEIEYFDITTMRVGQPLATVTMPRTKIDALARRNGSPAELFLSSFLEPGPTQAAGYVDTNVYPSFTTDIYPLFRQALFDPDNPFYVQFGVGASGSVNIARGLYINGYFLASIYDNFNTITRQSNSVLPHVRSDVAQYLKHGRYGIEALTADYYFKLAPEVYARASAGYLEQMFAGAGGEVLYRPFGERWAVGADFWRVRQRDFDVLFDLKTYQTYTGHVNVYYQLPWHELELSLHYGRYLAGDTGTTIAISRRFLTGVEIGGWATFTNVSTAKFGEGSFDKGIRIVIPLEWAAPFSSQAVYSLDLRPVQRDGGQRLAGMDQLYAITDPSDYGALAQQWNSVFKP